MKAFLLAAGRGERLRPLTDAVPKCMVPIQSVPLLAIWLELCRRHEIYDVLVNTHSHADLVRSYLGDHSNDLRVQITEEKTLLGSAGTLRANHGWTCSERDFWVFYGDVLTNTNITRMLEFHRKQRQIVTIGVYEVSNPSRCGIVTVDSDHLVRGFVEKPSNPSGNLAFSGILIATPAIFDVIPDRIPADIGFDVLPKLVGRMAAYPIDDYLVDIGTPANYRRAQLTWPGLEVAA
jgi:mannose-1-phosphate guanylyltransferase